MYSLDTNRERRLLWLLALTQFTIIMDFMVMMPLGPQIMRSFQISPAAFATAVSAYSWCSGLSGLLGATYIDRFDRRRLLLGVYALFALSNLACAFAPSFSILLVARAFAGITGGMLGSVVMAIVSDVIPIARRGAATGTIMTAFSLAAVAGVPAGILLGAHFGWYTPFILLTVLSVLIWLGCMRVVPVLAEHLGRQQPALRSVLPSLWRLLSNPRYMSAFAMTFVVMGSQMLVIPFISPVLVANHGVQPAQLSWLYMGGGAATFFTSRFIGRLSDRYGSRHMFRVMVAVSLLPILFVTHLPALPYILLLLFFPVFMVTVSGRMVPMQALLTTVPEPANRGAFLSTNSALQALGSGCGAWLGGLLLSDGANGTIQGYGVNGWLATVFVVAAAIWVSRVRSSSEKPMQGAAAAEPAGRGIEAARTSSFSGPPGYPNMRCTTRAEPVI